MAGFKSQDQLDLEEKIRTLRKNVRTMEKRKEKVDNAKVKLEDTLDVADKIKTDLVDGYESLRRGIQGVQSIVSSVNEMIQNETELYGLKKTEDAENLRNESIRLSKEITSANSKKNTAEHELENLRIEEG